MLLTGIADVRRLPGIGKLSSASTRNTMSLQPQRRRAERKALALRAWIRLVFLHFALCLISGSRALTPDGMVLLAFKQNVQDPEKVLRSWNESDVTPCKWKGVRCTSLHVTFLNLPRTDLSGTISPQLGNLTQLRRLGLHFNNLTGAIPATLRNLTNLRALYLNNNGLIGTLPTFGAEMQRLQKLDLANNKLEGAIPSSFCYIAKLNFLNLSNNMLSGQVPADGSLLNFRASSFAGNINLCGVSLLGLPACPQTAKSGNPWTLLHIVLLAAGIFLFLKLILGLLLFCRWLQNDKQREIHLGKGGKLVMFRGGGAAEPTSKEMLRAVRSIRKKDIVGEGGFGKVYKMTLKNQSTFAVKKLKQCLESARGFENELEVLGEIKHCNLVKLRGYCSAPSTKLLIYDFIPNGTLDELLHGGTVEERKSAVEWATRAKIALGIGRALSYLHHGCEPRIVHRDVSATNVLLDEDYEPRLSDFGLATLMYNNDTHVTVTVGGTFGYVAPDYARTGHATEKTDVYSYGVVLLELLSGRRPTDSSFSEEHVNLAGWVRSLRAKGLEFEILDTSLRDTVPHRELAIMMEIACKCVSLAPDERPRMDKVVQYLERLTEFDHTPSTLALSSSPSLNLLGLDVPEMEEFTRQGDHYVLNIDPGI